MIELVKYFRILFLSTKISRERLKDFCESHITRLNLNNPGGIFTTILDNVTLAYNAYYGDLSSESLNLAVQEGKTIAMNESRTALEQNISDNEGLISYTYRDNASFYQEFYPLGLKEYYDADLPTLVTISERYLNVLNSHAGDFPPAFVADYATVRGIFVANRTAQTAAKSNVDTERSDLAITRPALCRQLTTNLLTIALQYVGDEAKSDVYFDQAILNAAFKESERKVESEINPGETQNVFENITQSTVEVKGKNLGEEVLYIGFKATATEPASEAAGDHKIEVGESGSSSASELGWTTEKKFLNITNPGGTTGGYVIEKI